MLRDEAATAFDHEAMMDRGVTRSVSVRPDGPGACPAAVPP